MIYETLRQSAVRVPADSCFLRRARKIKDQRKRMANEIMEYTTRQVIAPVNTTRFLNFRSLEVCRIKIHVAFHVNCTSQLTALHHSDRPLHVRVKQLGEVRTQ